MSTIHILVTALVLSAAGIAQASEISDSPTPLSTKSRAEVAAEARRAPQTNELYDGRELQPAKPAMAAKRADVRAEARLPGTARPVSLYVGG